MARLNEDGESYLVSGLPKSALDLIFFLVGPRGAIPADATESVDLEDGIASIPQLNLQRRLPSVRSVVASCNLNWMSLPRKVSNLKLSCGARGLLLRIVSL